MKVFLQAIIGQVLFNLYIGKRAGQALSEYRSAKRIVYALLVIEFLAYMTGFVFHRFLPLPMQEMIMTVCSTWYIISIYIVMGLVVVDLIRLLDHYTGMIVSMWDKRQKNLVKMTLLAIFAVGSVFIGWMGYRTVRNPIVTHQEIYLDKKIDRPGNRLRIVLLTDIHMSETITKSYIQRMVKLVNEQHPDIILVGGDMFDFYSWYGYKDNIPQLYREMKAPLGTYYVMGNHEYRADTQQKKDWVPIAGGKLLIDTVIQPGGLVNIIARDDYTNFKTRKSLKELCGYIPQSEKSKPVILLEHQPRYLDSLEINKVDLALYGHTHDGQIFPFKYVIRLAFENTYGYEKIGNSQVYVSSGFGAAGPAMRLFTKSEVAVIDLIGRA